MRDVRTLARPRARQTSGGLRRSRPAAGYIVKNYDVRAVTLLICRSNPFGVVVW
jgi:hypothetical protein